MSADRSRMVVYDGRTPIGHVIERDGKFVAFDAAGNKVGTFMKMRDAMRAVPSPTSTPTSATR